jgi:hypothetical protein
MYAYNTIIASAISFAVLGSQASAQAADAINVQQACQEQYDSSCSAITIGSSCSDWACVCEGRSLSVNMQLWCSDHYPGTSAKCDDFSVYDWSCCTGCV